MKNMPFYLLLLSVACIQGNYMMLEAQRTVPIPHQR